MQLQYQPSIETQIRHQEQLGILRDSIPRPLSQELGEGAIFQPPVDHNQDENKDR